MAIENLTLKKRIELANNTNTPKEILVELAKDKNSDVRYVVANNTNTPKEALILLAKDKDSDVRERVANNTNTPKEALVELAKEEDKRVRDGVANNTNTPKEILVELAKDKNSDVRYGVANNTNTPKEALILLAKDKDRDVRYGVANNTNTPKEALILLAKDKDKDVRKIVFDKLSLKDIPKKYHEEYKQPRIFKLKEARKIKGKFTNNDLYLLYLKTLEQGQTKWNQVKQLPYGNVRIIQDFKKYMKGKPFTDKDIFKFNKIKKSKGKKVESWILKNSKIAKALWKSNDQVIFKKPNLVMQLNIPRGKFEKFVALTLSSPQDVKSFEEQRKSSEDPVSKKDYTLGWVRYTILDPKIVWIDEIQSNLWKVMEDKEFLRSIKNLNNILLHKFIQVAHKLLGAKKIYMPGIEIKRKQYDSDPPVSVYKDVPKKARFKRSNVSKEKLNKINLIGNKLLFPKSEVWVLSAKDYLHGQLNLMGIGISHKTIITSNSIEEFIESTVNKLRSK